MSGSVPLGDVLILGGGTAGWMAAAYINRFLRPAGGRVTLVESANLGTIGVGEATIPSMVQFLRLLDIPEEEFMRRCSATYKLAIRFDGWQSPGREYWHPFGVCGARVKGLDLFHWWVRERIEGREVADYAHHSLQGRLAAAGKGPRPVHGSSPIVEQGAYAYHLDASAFADYLREIATAAGVRHVFGDVESVRRDPWGDIAAVRLSGGRELEADLFVDCSGFKGRLIEQEMGDPWIDWSSQLLCDSAVFMPQVADEDPAPFTLSLAMPGGWSWRIPLRHRTGSGYVYSSAHLSADAAADALIALAGLRRARSADPRHLRIRVGRRTRFWTGNCVAVGLSGGFVEPLESTGIHLIQRAIMLLVDHWPDRRGSEALRQSFNRRLGAELEEVRDFVLLHYLLSERTEPFWQDARSVSVPDSLREELDIYDEIGQVPQERMHVFRDTSHFCILAGNGRLPRRTIPHAMAARPGTIRQTLRGIEERNAAFVSRMPSHAALLGKSA